MTVMIEVLSGLAGVAVSVPVVWRAARRRPLPVQDRPVALSSALPPAVPELVATEVLVEARPVVRPVAVPDVEPMADVAVVHRALADAAPEAVPALPAPGRDDEGDLVPAARAVVAAAPSAERAVDGLRALADAHGLEMHRSQAWLLAQVLREQQTDGRAWPADIAVETEVAAW